VGNGTTGHRCLPLPHSSYGNGGDDFSGRFLKVWMPGKKSIFVSPHQARLMIGTLRASARDPKLSHAEALRQSMLAMIDAAKFDADADPSLWAPFVVVGEPAKSR
jgi:hypothetical protein